MRQKISQTIQIKEEKGGVIASKETALPQMEVAMPIADEGLRHAIGKVEQTGIALQFVLELIKGAQIALALLHIFVVRLKDVHNKRIVDVQDTGTFKAQRLSQQHVLIATMLETFVERAVKDKRALDEEIGGTELLETCFVAHLCCVMPFGIVLVEVSQVVLLAFADADASIHYVMTGVFEITLNETGIRNGHVAI